MGCADPPFSQFGSKLSQPRYADVRLNIPMAHRNGRYFNPLDLGPDKMLLLKSHDGSEATLLPQDFFGAREVWFGMFI